MVALVGAIGLLALAIETNLNVVGRRKSERAIGLLGSRSDLKLSREQE